MVASDEVEDRVPFNVVSTLRDETETNMQSPPPVVPAITSCPSPENFSDQMPNCEPSTASDNRGEVAKSNTSFVFWLWETMWTTELIEEYMIWGPRQGFSKRSTSVMVQ